MSNETYTLKNYINDNISIKIEKYLYINLYNSRVSMYEMYNKISDISKDNIEIDEFLESFKGIIGFDNKKIKFITLDNINHENSQIINNNILEYSSLIVNDGEPTKLLLKTIINDISMYDSMLFIDVSDLAFFNTMNDALTYVKLKDLDDFFLNSKCVRIYKRLNNYYIFLGK